MNEDENLAPALDALKSAIAALIEPTVAYVENRVVTGDSLYNQLDESLGGTADHPAGGSGSKSKPPVWIEALELIRIIDHKVLVWQPGPLGPPTNVPETVWRLRVLAARSWRPQDTHDIQAMADDLYYFVDAINALLDPPKLIPLCGDECPVCHTTTVRRINEEGHFVKEPALIVEYGVGVTCRNTRQCRDETTGRPAFWDWSQRMFLGKLLHEQREAKKRQPNQEVA